MLIRPYCARILDEQCRCLKTMVMDKLMFAKQRYLVKKVFTILLLLLAGSAFAQTSFVQSRFLGMPPVDCTSCKPADDGILEYKLANPSIVVDPVAKTTDTTYTVQMRVIGGDSATKDKTRLAFAAARLTYDTDAFGEKVVGEVEEERVCDYTPSTDFEGKAYKYTLNDTTDSIFTITAYPQATTASSLMKLSDEFQDFVTITCKTKEGAQDANIAISGTDITSNMIYVYADASDGSKTISARRNIFPLVHNSLRGFRLDGKTYAEDYVLSSDGTEVRVTFSNPIATQLMANNFEVSTDTIEISSVSHNAGENKAVITFDKVPPAGSILRFAANAASIMSNSMPLASGNFIASLDHDAGATTANSITMDSRVGDQSTWTIEFSHSLDHTTVNKDNLCLTETYGACPEEALTSASIQSVSYREMTTTATVVINENSPGNKTLTIAFKRNAVRGADQRIVEEVQVGLRNMIVLTDSIGAGLNVVALDTNNDPLGNNKLVPTADENYVMRFKVTATENVPTLNTAASYQLKTVIGSTLGDITPPPGTPTIPMDSPSEVILQYTIPVSSVLTSGGADDVDGFTLVRNGARLLDGAGNPPVDDEGAVIGIDDRIDDGNDAVAMRDTTPPQITVTSASLTPSEAGKKYTIRFEVSSNDDPVPTIGTTASYSLIHLTNGTSLSSLPAPTEIRAKSDNTTATVTYEVTFEQYSAVRDTTGFTLGRSDVGTALLDADGNAPVKADTTLIAAGTRIDNTEAMRDMMSPRLEIMNATVVPDTANGNKYVVTFTVVSNDEPVPSLGGLSSYKLIHKPTTGETAIDEDDLMGLFGMEPGEPMAMSTDQMTATVKYTVVFTDLATQTQITEGFALGRGDSEESLLDSSGNLPLPQAGNNTLAAGAEIDERPSALAARDTIPPQIDVGDIKVVADDTLANAYDITITATPSETVRGSNTTSSYSLLKIVNKDDPPELFDARPPTTVSEDENTRVVTITYEDVEITPPLHGFTLGRRGDNLRDLSNNDPVEAEDDMAKVNADEPLDPGTVGAVPNPPKLTVEAVSEDNMEAVPTPDNGDEYTVKFKVTSTKAISDIESTSSYVLLHIPTDGNTELDLPELNVITLSSAVHNMEKTISTLTYVVKFTDTITQTQITKGFTLGRAGTADDCNLCDDVSIAPERNDGTTIGSNERIDNREHAVAQRDTTPPQITVGGYIQLLDIELPSDPLINNGKFNPQFSVNIGTEENPKIRGIFMGGSYRILGKQNDGKYIVFNTIPTIDTCSDLRAFSISAGRTTVPGCRNIAATFSIDPSTAIDIGEIVLGRASDALRDLSNNDPIVASDTETSPRVVRTDATDALPLDLMGHSYTLDRSPPFIEVTVPNQLQRTGNRIEGSFALTSEDAIHEIGSTSSYVLLRVSTGSTPTEVLNSATITANAPADKNSATVNFDITESNVIAPHLNTQWKYTLGRRANLTDLEGNPLQDPVTNAEIGVNGRIDSRGEALADIPPDNPVITLEVRDTDGNTNDEVEAIPDPGNALIYRGSFTVTGNEPIKNIGSPSAYQVVRIFNEDDREDLTADTTISVDTVTLMSAEVSFATTLSNITEVRATKGFTLKPLATLTDLSDNPPLGNPPAFSGDKWIARRDQMPPALTVRAQGDDGEEAQPENMLMYIGSFLVTTPADDPIRNLNSPEAYKLLIQTVDGNLRQSTATLSISDIERDLETGGYTEATVSFSTTLTQTQLEATGNNAVAGFTLANALTDSSGLQDIASNLPVTGDLNRLDTDPASLAQIASPPRITLRADNRGMIPTSNDFEYEMHFETIASEAVTNIGETGSYNLIRITADDNPPSIVSNALANIEATADSENPEAGTTATLTYTVTFIGSDEEKLTNVRATAGFTLGLASTDNRVILSDKAGNLPVKENGDPIYDTDNTTLLNSGVIAPIRENIVDSTAVAAKDTTSPTITVTMASLTPSNIGRTYEITFQVSATEPISTIGMPNSYLLQHLVSSGTAIDFSSETAQVSGVGSDNMSARVIYTVTINDYDDVRRTTGFTLGRSSIVTALVDAFGNAPVKSDRTTLIGNDARIDDAAAAAALRETTQPIILITEATATPRPDNPKMYSLSFTVTVDNERTVRTLRHIDPYWLYRFYDGGKSERVTATADHAKFSDHTAQPIDNYAAKIRYTVTFTTIETVMETERFGLYRSTAATALVDNFGNAPVRSDDTSIDSEKEIGLGTDAERAVRETDGADITVAVVDKVGTDNMVDAEPFTNNGNKYTIGFTVTNTEHGTKPISSIATSTSYVILRQLIGDSLSSIPVDVENFSSTPTGTVASSELTFVVTVDSENTTMTKGFVLGRAAGGLLDINSNLPELSNTDIRDGDAINETIVANRDTTKPSITVAAGEAMTSDNTNYTFSFTVTADEDVRGIGDEDSYSLLVAEDEEGIANPSMISSMINTPVVSGSGRERMITYSNIDVDTLQVNNADIGLPHGFMLGRANDGLRDLANNDPVQIDADGNRTSTEVGNGELLQLEQVVQINRAPPKIEVIATSSAEPTDNNGEYRMSFSTSATETVQNIGLADSYRLIRINTERDNEGNLVLTRTDGTAENDTSTNGKSAEFTYTVSLNLAAARATTGFTLALDSGDDQANLRSVRTMLLPVKVNGDPIYNTEDTTLLNSGVIAPIRENIVDSTAVAARDTKAPRLTVKAVGMAEPVTPTTYSGSFRVTAKESIKGIGTAESYQLLRIPRWQTSDGPNGYEATVLSDAELMVSGSGTSTSETISFTASLDISTNTKFISNTFGFALGRKEIDDGGLRDQSDNEAFHYENQGNKLTLGDAAIAKRDTTAPVITVVALGEGDIKAVPTEDDGNEYTIRFTVTSTKEISGIGSMASYIVMRISTDGRLKAISGNLTSALTNPAGDMTTLTYVVTTKGATQTQRTAGFTLGRGGTNSDCHLCDDSGNPPREKAGQRIDNDDAAVAARDTTPPQIDVTEIMVVADDTLADAYDITIKATRTEEVQGFETKDAYRLLMVASEGAKPALLNPQPTSGMIEVTVDSEDPDKVTIEYKDVEIKDVEIPAVPLPYGLTLGRRGDNLRDLSNNDPVDEKDGTTKVDANAALDSDAIGVVPDTSPKITLRADNRGMVPTSTDFEYKMTFTITADERVTGIGTTATYSLVHIPNNGDRMVVPPTGVEAASSNMDNGTMATFTYTVMLADLDAVRATEGYTLALASGAAANALRDLTGNSPVKRDGTALYEADGTTLIGLGELAPIGNDSRVVDTAVAARDTEAPTLTVVAGDLMTTADFTYSGSFTVNAGEEIENIDAIASYDLLRVPLDGITPDYDSAEVIDTTLTPLTATPPSGATTSVEISFTSVTLAGAEEARATYGFILGIASSAELRDRSGNDVTVIENTVEAAAARVEKDSPQITITTESLDISSSEGSYDMSFVVSSNEDVSTLDVAGSYQLVRVIDNANSTDTTVAIPTADVIPSLGSGDDMSVSIDYTADLSRLSKEEIRNTEGFTLIRATDGQLLDMSGNKPVKADGSTAIAAGGVISPITDGEIDVIATIDRTPPEITLTARDTDGNTNDGVEAIPDATDPLIYSGSFTVRANEAIPNIGNIAAYRVVRVPNVGARVGLTANTTITIDSSTVTTLSAVVEFMTTLVDITEVQGTAGFTLNPLTLTDADGNPPQGNLFSGENQIARRDRTPSRLRVTAATGSQSTFANGPLTMTAAFRVQAIGGETIRGIDEAGSYDIWHHPIVSGSDAPGAGSLLTSGIGSAAIGIGTSDAQGQLVTAAITFASLDDARGTYGFTLTRKDNLRDLSSNDIVDIVDNTSATVSIGNRIDASAGAIWQREDRTGPTITVVAGAAESSGDAPLVYTGSFQVSSNDVIRNINFAAAYQLLVQTVGGTFNPISGEINGINNLVGNATAGYTGATVNFSATISEAQLTATDDDAIAGFALANALTDSGGLQDIAGNVPVLHLPGDRLSDAATAIAQRETVQPVITVVAQGTDGAEAQPDSGNPLVYTGSFRVTTPADDPVRNLYSVSVYKLLVQTVGGDFSDIAATISTSTLVGDARAGYTAVTVSFSTTLDQAQLDATGNNAVNGFTLGDRRLAGLAGLRDISGNLPVVYDDPLNRLDNRDAAIAQRVITMADTTSPEITLTADSDMIPTSTDFQYEMTFTITADESVKGIGTAASYALVHIPSSGPRMVVLNPTNVEAASSNIADGMTATYTYTVTLADLAAVRATEGYTLALATNAAADALEDADGNPPVKSDDDRTSISGGEVLAPITGGKVEDSAIAKRDTEAPTLTVVAGDLTATADLTYSGSFTVSAGETVVDIGVADSYELLRVPLSSGNPDYDNLIMITTRLTPTPALGATTSVEISFTSVTLAGAEEARATYGFILGIASSAELRDRSGNDVTVIENTAEAAAARVEKDSPQITITTGSLDISSSEGSYDMSFVVSSNEDVSTLDVAGSYQLVRVIDNANSTDTTVAIPTADVIPSLGSGDDMSVSIDYTADLSRLSKEEIRNTEGFTLIRATDGQLLDMSGNKPVKADGSTAIAAGGVISPITDGEIDVIATIDRTPPEITLTVRDTDGNTSDGVEAIPDVTNALIYRGSFAVTGNEEIENIGDIAAYRVVRIPTVGEREELTANTTITIDSSTVTTLSAVVEFMTTLAGITQVQGTAGFTLNPLTLTDADGNPPQGNLFSGENQIARRDRTPSRLRVTAATGSQSTFANGPLTMTAAFRVQAIGGETIRGIDEAGSYDIWRYPIVSGSDAPGAGSLLTSGIGSAAIGIGTSDAQGQLVTAAITFASLAAARGTYGFTLTRKDNLRDLSSNDIVDIVDNTSATVSIGNRIDASAGAIWQRGDRTGPTITVVAGAAESSGDAPLVYTGSFQVSSNDVIRNINSAAAYQLLVQTVGGTFDPISGGINGISNLVGNATAGYTGATVNFSATISEAQLTATDDDAIAGFALANALTDSGGLQDIAGNVPVLHLPGDRLSDAATAIAQRETVQPVITVVAQGTDGAEAQPDSGNPLVYTGSFRVTTPADDPVRNLYSVSVYKLLVQTVGGDFSDIAATISTSTLVGDARAGYTAVTVSFSTTLDQAQLDATGNNAVNGFTLGDRRLAGLAGLRDISGNLPVVYDDPLNRLDNRDAAIAQRVITMADTTSPEITLTADSDMIPTSTDFQYEMTFTITADESVKGIGTAASYALVHIPSSGPRMVVLNPTNVEAASSNIADGMTATYTYTVTLADLAAVRATEGYTLALATNAAADALEDADGNPPVKSDDDRTSISGGEVLAPITGGKVEDSAIAKRDTEAPTLTVVAGDLTATADFSYSGSFTVSAGETVVDIGVVDSYELLRVPLSSGNPDYDNLIMITTRLTPTPALGATTSVEISFTSVTLTNAEEARGTYGFILGIASSAELRDRSGNDVTVIENTVEAAAARVEKDSPQITITTESLDISSSEGSYDMSFVVSSNEDVSTLDVAGSYQLVRVIDNANSTDTTVAIPTADVIPSLGSGDDMSVSIDYMADLSRLSKEEIRNTEGFTLIRATDASLIDRSGNMPVKTDGTPIATEDVISPITSGEIDVMATIDRTPPEITVEARDAESTDVENAYKLVFDVSATEAVPDLGTASAYVLLQRDRNGDETEWSEDSMITAKANPTNTTATISYTVTIMNAQSISSFTLGRAEGKLLDNDANEPVDPETSASIGENGRLDSREAALAVITGDNPTITVEAVDMEAVPKPDDGNEYTVKFKVTSTKAVSDIGTTSSYVLLHIPTETNTELDLLQLKVITTGSAVHNTAETISTLTYVVKFDTTAQTLMTEGFTLGRAAGGLKDGASNDPVRSDGTLIKDNERIDNAPAAVALRDTGASTMTVVATIAMPVANDPETYTGSFTVSSGESIRDIGTPKSYHLIRIPISGNGNPTTVISSIRRTSAEMEADSTGKRAVMDFSVRLGTLEDVRETAAFTLGRVPLDAGEGLRDLSNNAVVAGSGPLYRLDTETEAEATRDTTSPQITVTATNATLQSGEGTYQMTFTVSVANNEDVPTLDDGTSYQLVRIFKDTTTEPINNPDEVVVVDGSTDQETTLTYTVTLTEQIEDTAGFTLARATAASLLDKSGNEPVRDDDESTEIVANASSTEINTNAIIALITDINSNAIARTPLSADATLSALTLTETDGSQIDIEAFESDTIAYTANVRFSLDKVIVSPTASSDYASIRLINNSNELVESGSTSTVTLNDPGTTGISTTTTVEIVVTPEDGSMATTYTITITRAATASNDATLRELLLENISFTFYPTTNTYSLNVENDVSETTITAIVTHPGASITSFTVNDIVSNSNKISLEEGQTKLEIIVTAENNDENTYTITITRAAAVSDVLRLRIKVFLEGPLQ